LREAILKSPDAWMPCGLATRQSNPSSKMIETAIRQCGPAKTWETKTDVTRIRRQMDRYSLHGPGLA
jgi:hypothetical protein